MLWSVGLGHARGLLADEKRLQALAGDADPLVKPELFADNQKLRRHAHGLLGQPELGRETTEAVGVREVRQNSVSDSRLHHRRPDRSAEMPVVDRLPHDARELGARQVGAVSNARHEDNGDWVRTLFDLGQKPEAVLARHE